MTLSPKQLSKLMSELGKRTSKKKAASSKRNGRKGGRPRKAKLTSNKATK